MRIAIVDDLAGDRALLRERLERQLQRRSVQADLLEFESGEAFLAAEREQRFTAAFLDVYMTGMSGETEQAARTFLADNGYTFPVYFDKDSSAAAAFGVNSIPQTYLIDAEGNILGGYMGAMTSSIIDEGIQMLLNTAKD